MKEKQQKKTELEHTKFAAMNAFRETVKTKFQNDVYITDGCAKKIVALFEACLHTHTSSPNNHTFSIPWKQEK